jgi:hypothetical protein
MLKIDVTPSSLVTKTSIVAKSTKTSTNPKSLNRNVRIQSLKRIMFDNKNLVKRLNSTASHYSAKNWDKEHVRNTYIGHKII